MKGITKSKWIIVAEYAFVVIIIVFLLYHIFHLGDSQMSVYPFNYTRGGDGVTAMVTVKSMWENGWIYENPRLGAPYIVENYDATTMELFLNGIEQLLVWMTRGNWVLAFNLFYLSGYLLAGLTAYYTLKQLEISGVIAAPTAILYAFAPYHQMRGTGHLFLGMYFMVPIMVLYLYRLMKEELLFQKGERGWITKSNIIRFLTLIIMALTGIYYAFFTCFFLCVVILYCFLNQEPKKKRGSNSMRNVRQAFFSLGVIVGTLLLSALPNFIYWIRYGKPVGIAKGGEGAEIYALKIIQLLLPSANHRLEIFMRLRNLYDTAYPLVNENGTASLGIFMASGFVILCLALFAYRRIPEKSNLRVGSILNLSVLLFGTVGGFAVVLSFFSGAIRCYNRFSIFVAMFSLVAIDCVIEKIKVKWFEKTSWKKIVFAVGMLVVMFCGIYDQTAPVDSNVYAEAAQCFCEDAEFIREIELAEEDGAMVYQLPYMHYPENGGIQQMTDYAHMVGYLHSDTLRWSYGAPAGREGDQWMAAVNELPFQEQIATIQTAGFAGIYIDWNAYLDDERIVMEEIIAKEIGTEPIVDATETRVYYSFGEGVAN